MSLKIKFTKSQLDKLSELCLDLSKGVFLAALAAPAISSVIDLFTSIKGLMLGLIFVYLTLMIEKIKERL